VAPRVRLLGLFKRLWRRIERRFACWWVNTVLSRNSPARRMSCSSESGLTVNRAVFSTLEKPFRTISSLSKNMEGNMQNGPKSIRTKGQFRRVETDGSHSSPLLVLRLANPNSHRRRTIRNKIHRNPRDKGLFTEEL
jgi:hypothetical protein